MADEQFRLRAIVEDNFSGPLRRLNQAMKQVSDPAMMRGMRKDWGELQKGVASVSREVGSVLSPALGRVGITSLGVAGAIAGIGIQLNRFGTGLVAIDRLSRETGVAADKLRVFQDVADRAGVAEQFGAGLTNFTDKLRGFS